MLEQIAVDAGEAQKNSTDFMVMQERKYQTVNKSCREQGNYRRGIEERLRELREISSR